MRIAFCAPLKAPDHPQPSGDRTMARLLIAALRAAGHSVTLASRFRSFDAGGDPSRQARLRELGLGLARRLAARCRASPPAVRPELWFTYHVYHKAPDWIGPPVSEALDIPYVVAEASHAPKQVAGRWAIGYEGARAAIARADLVVTLNPADAQCLRPLRAADAPALSLRAFTDVAALRRAASRARPAPPALAADTDAGAAMPLLLTVAMMRPGAKLASYRLLAAALARLGRRPWRLAIVGDGPARREVAAAFAPLGRRVVVLGRCDPPDLYRLHAAAALYVWPAIGEAYGMAMLEAQALGLPVVAGAAGGVGTIVRHGLSGILVRAGDVAAFATAMAMLLDDARRRRAMAAAARRITADQHDIPAAARRLDEALAALVAAREGAG